MNTATPETSGRQKIHTSRLTLLLILIVSLILILPVLI